MTVFLRLLAAHFALLVAVLACACGSGGGGAGTSPAATSAPPSAPPPAPAGADITLLFMGNSHTGFHDLPATVAALVRTVSPGQRVEAVTAPGWMFLEDRVHDEVTMSLLRGRPWSAVVLQAQKYSSSGQFTYSTAEAEELVRIARGQRALPVMFPEWPRRGIDETARIFALHVSIAVRAPACVAPVPQAFDLARARAPALTLHDSDGNHAAPAGAFLAAAVIAATVASRPPRDFAAVDVPGVPAATQEALRAVAQETVETNPPRLHCPGDR